MVDEERVYGKPTEDIQSCTSVSQVLAEENSAENFIPRRTGTHKPYEPISLGNDIRSEEQMEERRKFDNPEEMKDRREQLTRYFLNKYKRYTQEQMDVYSTFAQRMRDNTLAFEKFCSTM